MADFLESHSKVHGTGFADKMRKIKSKHIQEVADEIEEVERDAEERTREKIDLEDQGEKEEKEREKKMRKNKASKLMSIEEEGEASYTEKFDIIEEQDNGGVESD
eukprot:g6426.t1